MPEKVRQKPGQSQEEARRKQIDALNADLRRMRPAQTIGLWKPEDFLFRPDQPLPNQVQRTARFDVGAALRPLGPFQIISSSTPTVTIGNNTFNSSISNVVGTVGNVGFSVDNADISAVLNRRRVNATFQFNGLSTNGPLGIIRAGSETFPLNANLNIPSGVVNSNGNFILQDPTLNNVHLGTVSWDGRLFSSGLFNLRFDNRGNLDSVSLNLVGAANLVEAATGNRVFNTKFGQVDLDIVRRIFKDNHLGVITFRGEELRRLRNGDFTFLANKLHVKPMEDVCSAVNNFLGLLHPFPRDIEDFKKSLTVIVERSPFDRPILGLAYKPGRNTVLSLTYMQAPYIFNMNPLNGVRVGVPTNFSYIEAQALFGLGSFRLEGTVGAALLQGTGAVTLSMGGRGYPGTNTLTIPARPLSGILPTGRIGISGKLGNVAEGDLRLGVSVLPALQPLADNTLRFRVRPEPEYSIQWNKKESASFRAYVGPGGGGAYMQFKF